MFSLLVRLMGKREVGQLSPFDFVVAIMIAELAALPLEATSITFSHALIPIATLAAIEMGFSYVSLKSNWLRNLIDGDPAVVVRNGQILNTNLRKLRYNVKTCWPNCGRRTLQIFQRWNMPFWSVPASWERDQKKSQHRPVTPQNLGIETKYEGMPVPLILDGEVLFSNLTKQTSYQWLLDS